MGNAKVHDIRVRATSAEKKALAAAARKDGRSLSRWLIKAGEEKIAGARLLDGSWRTS